MISPHQTLFTACRVQTQKRSKHWDEKQNCGRSKSIFSLTSAPSWCWWWWWYQQSFSGFSSHLSWFNYRSSFSPWCLFTRVMLLCTRRQRRVTTFPRHRDAAAAASDTSHVCHEFGWHQAIYLLEKQSTRFSIPASLLYRIRSSWVMWQEYDGWLFTFLTDWS